MLGKSPFRKDSALRKGERYMLGWFAPFIEGTITATANCHDYILADELDYLCLRY